MNVGDYIKEKRKERKLTQLRLSKLIDIDVTVVSRIEKGIRKPQSNILKKLSKALSVNEQELKEYYFADKIYHEYGDKPETLDTIKKAVDILDTKRK
jgi:transcriptional regulator with XRE-family HTH domain